MIIAFLKAYIFTIIIETIIINLLSNRSIWLNTIVSILMNTITLPFVWFVFPFLIYDKYICLVISEIFAFIIEATFLELLLLKNWKGGIIAFIANQGSFLFGLLLC